MAEQDFMAQWNDWLSKPENRAGMINFGLQLMQPVGLGQTAMGHVGQAIGHAGEGQAAMEAEEEKRRQAQVAEAQRDGIAPAP